MAKKKISIITDTWTNNVNGIVTSLLETKKLLEKRDFEVSVINPMGYRSISLPSYPEIRLALISQKKMKAMLEAQKPDYIHIATEGTLGLNARMCCVKNNWKFTTSYHTHLPEYVKVRFYALKETTYSYLRWFHAPAEHVFVSTNYLKEQLELNDFEHVVIVPLGVDVERFKKNHKARLPRKLKKPVFTFLGRVAPEKNIEAFLKCDLPGSKLIIGDGPQREQLEQEYKDTAIFAGFKKGEKLIDSLSISDVLVFPSLTDTFGLAIVEALSCGLPIAAFDVPGPRDIVTSGLDGYLGENLAQNAISCLELKPQDCRATAIKYSWEKSVDSFIENLVQK